MLWDIFCKVIDNHGDIGVCWRLAAQLAERGHAARLWVDDARALAWMAPGGHPGVQVLPWDGQATAEPGDAVIEAFGCELDASYQAAIARRTRERGHQPAWINLEYLSAEVFAERCHGLPSPVMAGPAAGLTKRFFYPGFTPDTGGLLRERDLLARQQSFAADAWLAERGVVRRAGAALVSLFCYEPPALARLLARWAAGPQPTQLLVTPGRAQAAVAAARAALDLAQPRWNIQGLLGTTSLPYLTQPDYDRLLWACDLNFVRGEDSLVRALWAGQPFVWHIYPQDDGAHHAKLDAFLGWMQAPSSLRDFHTAWNAGVDLALPEVEPAAWRAAAQNARARLLAQPDLATQLLDFAAAPASIR